LKKQKQEGSKKDIHREDAKSAPRTGKRRGQEGKNLATDFHRLTQMKKKKQEKENIEYRTRNFES